MRQPSSAGAGETDSAETAVNLSRESGVSGLAFGCFRLDPDDTLYRGDSPLHLPAKELAALRLLLAHAGKIVTTQQLRQALWGNVHVTADSIPRCLSSLRAHLAPETCIQTVYKRGYRFSLEVRPLGVAPAGALPRLAILPFHAAHGVAEHLGEAIAEETSARLSAERNPMVALLAQDSVFTLASRGLGAQQIGQLLRADLVLAGTLRVLPARYRLRAEIIRVSDGIQLWVEDLFVPNDRIAGLEIELARRLLLRLNSKSLVLSASAAAGPSPEDSAGSREAYAIYQQAHHDWQTLERHRMQDGLQRLLHAIDLDPSLTAARVDLVNLCVTEAFYGYMSPAVAADTARQAVAPWVQAAGSPRWGRAMFEHFTGRAEAMLPGIGWLCFQMDRDLPAALSAFSLSAHLPHDPWITRLRMMLELSRHRFGQAIELLRSVIRIDPFSPWLHAALAWALHLDGQAQASVECIRHAVAQFPEHETSRMYGAILLAFNGETAQGIEFAQDLARRLPYNDIATAVHAYALACAGRPDEARVILERLQWLNRERFVLNTFTPAVYIALGDQDAALAELRASAESRCPWFFQMLADPRLKPLHGRAEFAEMLQILAAMEAAADPWAAEASAEKQA
jgi:DNA-binding winged helix-turn-helix (wHTH) protein/tetratricopeptide (TPR) repeat protein